jgi:cellulose synthase operon protein C
MSVETRTCHRWVRFAMLAAVVFLCQGIAAYGQQRQGPVGQQKRAVPKSKQDPVDARDRKALAYYANAADYQNNGAFELAAEEWQKLVKEYPEHPQASAAWHHMGVCHLQRKEPDYGKAIEAFEQALKDPKLELREESLINLSWALVTQARGLENGSAVQRRGYQRARDRMLEFLKAYGDGAYVDQALFYLGDVEHILGDRKRSIAYFKRFLEAKNLVKSPLRPDAVYALAVAYEEEQDLAEAKRRYNEFMREYADHRLAGEIRLRMADIMLRENKLQDAEQVLAKLASSSDFALADYALLRLGYAQAQQGRQADATERYAELQKRFPQSLHVPAALLFQGQSLYQQGLYDAAAASFSKLVDQDVPQTADAVHWLAITLLRQNKAEEALAMLTKVLDKVAGTPIGPAIQLDFADALYAIPDKLEEAQAAYEKFATQSPDDPLAPRAAYNAAFAALQGGKFADARRWAEIFLAKYPNDPLRNEVAYIAAESLLQQGEQQAAAEAYAKLLKADPNNANALLWKLRLGVASYSARKYDQAIELLTPLLDEFELDAQRAEAQFILGGCYLYLEKNPEAIKYLEASHTTSDHWALADEVLLLLADAHQRSKNNPKARETLELLLQKYPNSRLKSQVEYKLAQLSAAMGDLENAINRYRSVVRDESATGYHHFATYGIAWCLMQQDRYTEALEMLQPLVLQQPRDSIADEAQLAIGICQRKLGRLDDAVAALEKFLASSPLGGSLANGLYELGLAYTELGMIKQANAQFQRVVAEYPSYPSLDKVLYELAWNHHENDQGEQAAEYFDRLVKSFPNSEMAAEARYMQGERSYDAKLYDRAAELYERVLQDTQDESLIEKALYKFGWTHYQRQQYDQAAAQFARQTQRFPTGPLAVDALFMHGECAFKQDRFEDALDSFVRARELLESSAGRDSAASAQVRSLIYLHGGQALRELKRWDECESWLMVVIERFPDSPYLPTALYELGFCKQNQNKLQEALTHYAEVADAYRNEVAARARFMMGEVYFSQRDFVKAIPEFQRVMFGFGGEKAPEDIKNWQARSAFEAARCSEVLLENLNGNARQKVVDTAKEFYEFIVQKHASHELAAQAQTRLGELRKLR